MLELFVLTLVSSLILNASFFLVIQKNLLELCNVLEIFL